MEWYWVGETPDRWATEPEVWDGPEGPDVVVVDDEEVPA
jgi:hypothetical protein